MWTIRIKPGGKFPEVFVRRGKRWEMGGYGSTLSDAKKMKASAERIDPSQQYVIVKLILEGGRYTTGSTGYRIYYRRK